MDVHVLGCTTELLRHDENGSRGVIPDVGEALLPAAVRIGESYRLGEELVLRTGEAQLDLHAALEAHFGEEQVAARGSAAETQVSGTGSDLIKCNANPCRRCLGLGRREAW